VGVRPVCPGRQKKNILAPKEKKRAEEKFLK
jgi:hypothetical protein